MNFSDEKCAAFRILDEGMALASKDLLSLSAAIKTKALSNHLGMDEIILMRAQYDHASNAAIALALAHQLLSQYLDLWSEPVAGQEGGGF